MDDFNGCFIIFLTMLVFFLGFLFHYALHRDEPTAMEVYQGKTTLQITYKDSIPVDSVVVYKND